MPVSFSELELAFEFVSMGGFGENEAFLDKETGKIYCRSSALDEEDLPVDIDDNPKYVEIPHKSEFDLGKPLVLDFVAEVLPEDYEQVRQIFRRKGAYARFKELLAHRGALERWYDFSSKAEAAALRQWCEENSIELGD